MDTYFRENGAMEGGRLPHRNAEILTSYFPSFLSLSLSLSLSPSLSPLLSQKLTHKSSRQNTPIFGRRRRSPFPPPLSPPLSLSLSPLALSRITLALGLNKISLFAAAAATAACIP